MLHGASYPTKSERAISDQIIRIVRSLCRKAGIDSSELAGIGIASAGPLDLSQGEVVNSTNLPFTVVPLVRPITQELDVLTQLLNDCTAGAE